MSKKDTDTSLDFNSSKEVTRMMLRTLFSTTWRIFVPVLALFSVGLLVDSNIGTRPYGMIIGTIFGIIIGAILVTLQIKTIRAERRSNGS